MDLLIDVNIAIDVCARRMPFAPVSAAALQHCQALGGRLWLYAGSVQTLEYSLLSELRRTQTETDKFVSKHQGMVCARQTLKAFAQDKHWLAALADEGDVFDSLEPEDEQLVRALGRFASGSIKLLTRDEVLCEQYPEHTITPMQYLAVSQSNKSIDFIDLKTQQDHIRPQLEMNIHRVLHHGQYIMGPEVKQLEEKLSEYTGAKHCITVASGTEALLISLMALGVKAGDEVITTPFTFVATAEVIALLGATPVFVDVQPDTCNIDPMLIKGAITAKTKAIMPVSLYGQVADMDEINAIAAHYGIPVIEDAAQSFGATYKGKRSCNLSTIGCTSFFPSKPLGCYGDGGAIFTNDEALAKAMREIRVHGQEKRYYHTLVGVGGRMDTLQCAVVLAKLEQFSWEIEQRIAAGNRYIEQLASVANVITPVVREDRDCVWGQFTVQVADRDAVLAKLNAAAIPTAVHYPVPLHRQPAYSNLCRISGTLENADAVSSRVVSLPMHPYISAEILASVVQTLIS